MKTYLKAYLQKKGISRVRSLILPFYFWKHPIFALKYLRESNSQINQDAFVLSYFRSRNLSLEKRYFVEFGATDGISLSNTLILERNYGWKGVLVEPGRIWQGNLTQNRNCEIDFGCVFSESGLVIEFHESIDARYSTINKYADVDLHVQSREEFKSYEVSTISLEDLLVKYNAPQIIDYLSIDTEGSEFDILAHVNFQFRKFRVITVEHNFTKNRYLIHELLTKNGYKRILKWVSQMEDWYILGKV
jgi:FkbM family methyltransferase